MPGAPQNAPAGTAVTNPCMGLFLDRPAFTMDPKALSACNNVRIELGRVRSDLIGWNIGTVPQVAGGLIYISQFINSQNQRRMIGVTPTDLISLAPGGANTYLTPIYEQGLASVSNGSPTVTGLGTRWATDIQYNDQATVTAMVPAGNTSAFVSALTSAAPGVPITDLTTPGAIPAGTYVTSVGLTAAGQPAITWSQANIATIAVNDVLQLGSGINLRPNVRAGDQISFGSNFQNSISATWYTVQSVNSDTSITLTTNYSGTNLTGSFYTVRQLLTNTTTGPSPSLPVCSSTNYPAAGGFSITASYGVGSGDDEWFFTNGIDPVVVAYWGCPTSAFFSRSIPFLCAAVLQKQGLLVCGGLTEANGTQLGTSIASSDNGFPQKMAGGVAFQGIVTDGPFLISRLAILGSTLMIYCSGQFGAAPTQSDDGGGSVTSATFVGYPTIWAFSDVIKTRGPLAGGAVAEFPDRHQFLAIDGEYRYNGLFIQVMNDHVWRQALKIIDQTRAAAIFTTIWPETGDLIWAVPQTTDPPGQLFGSSAYVEHYMEQANSYLFKPFTYRDFPFTSAMSWANSSPATFASFTGTYAQFNENPFPFDAWGYGGSALVLLSTDLAGNVWDLYAANTQAGTAPLCTATWGSRIVGDQRTRSLVKRVYPFIEYQQAPVANVSVTLGLQDAPAGPVLTTDTQLFNPSYPNVDIRFTTHYRRGRVASVTISDQSGVGWVCDGYDWDWVPGGAR